MRKSFFRRLFPTAFFVLFGFLGLQQTAQAQQDTTGPTCFSTCFNQHANDQNLICCDQACDARTYCDNLCACGNGAIDTVCDHTEQCDDGNTVNGDGCSSTCQTEVDDNCGDGILNDNCGNPEECDDGNTVSGDGCDSNCNVEPSGGTFTPEPATHYRGIATTDLVALRKTVNQDVNIAPHDFVVAAVKGVSFSANPVGPANLQVTVMPKLTAALNAVLRVLFGFNPPSTTVPMSLNIGCVYPKTFCFPVDNPDGTTTMACAKGCRETAKAAWGAGVTACPTNIGCCADPGTTPNSNYTCRVLTPGVADSIQGNGIY